MKSAIQLIREADRGQLLTDFEGALDEIVNAIELHGGVGEINIKLKIKKRGDAYMVSSELKSAIPQPPRVDALFFFDADKAEFTRKDPRQPDLPMVVDADFRNNRGSAAEEK